MQLVRKLQKLLLKALCFAQEMQANANNGQVFNMQTRDSPLVCAPITVEKGQSVLIRFRRRC